MKAKTVTIPPELLAKLIPILQDLGREKADRHVGWLVRRMVEGMIDLINTPKGERTVPGIVKTVTAWRDYPPSTLKTATILEPPTETSPANIWEQFGRN